MDYAFVFQDNLILAKLAIELKRYMNYDVDIGNETVENIIQTLIALTDYQEKYMKTLGGYIEAKEFEKISKTEINKVIALMNNFIRFFSKFFQPNSQIVKQLIDD